jgi:N-sulfoglucosamine sulfohydrolase
MKTIFISLFALYFSYGFSQKENKKQPNIVWIVCEDLSPHLGCYGDRVTKTPNLDQLAREGVMYTNAYTTAGVCAPSRNAIITGRFQTANGGHHMRTLAFSQLAATDYPEGFKPYSALLPEGVYPYTHYLRKAGYYCTNNSKEDYQFIGSPAMWDESSMNAHWKNRKDKSQPFFSIFNLMVTHEYQVWARDNEPLLVSPSDVIVPPVYPDDSISRHVIARFLTNAMIMDKQAGEIINELKEAGLYDNTIIFFYSDHGDGMPYFKREILHRGLHIPLIIKAPFLKKGTTDHQLISSVDLAPTLLSLAGIKIPKNMHGINFLNNNNKLNKYIYAARDRMDSEIDRCRSVFDGRFNYIRNYFPDKPYYQNIAFRLQNRLMTHMLQLKEEGKLNAQQLKWFEETKPKEELFDVKNDPFELTNLADKPEYQAKLKELRKAHEAWKEKFGDYGDTEESIMVSKWWKGQDTPPVTKEPKLLMKGNRASIQCETKGAVIGFRKSGNDVWTIYDQPIEIQKGDSLYYFAHRIGYTASEKLFIAPR